MDSYNNYTPNNSYSNIEEKAPNVFQQFAYAFIPPKYNLLAKVKTGSMIGFVTLLVLVFCIVSLGKLLVAYYAFGGVERILDEVPEFEISDGEFWIEEPFMLDEDKVCVLITDEVDSFSQSDVRELMGEGYQSIILMARTGCVIGSNGDVQEIKFSDFKDLSVDKDWIADTVMPIILVCVCVAYLFIFIGAVLWYFLCAAIYLLIAMAIAKILKRELPSGSLLRAAIYSKAVFYIIAKLLGLIPLASLGIPFWIRVILTCVFMGFAIQQMAPSKTDMGGIEPTSY